MAKVYIRTDERDRVTAVSSSVFLRSTEGWTEVDEGDGDRFVHAQNNYLPGPLFDEHGVPRYRYGNGGIAERAAGQIAADIRAFASPPPSNEKLLEIIENSCGSVFDGLKLIADREHPIPLRLPMIVRRNLIYSYNGVNYVCVEDGTADSDNFSLMLAED